MMTGIDTKEVVMRILRYLIEGLGVGLIAFYIPRGRRMPLEEVFMIGLSAAVILSLTDLVLPGTISNSLRSGVGFGVGANMVGFPATKPMM